MFTVVIFILKNQSIEHYQVNIDLLNNFFKKLTIISTKKRNLVIYDKKYFVNLFRCCKDMLSFVIFSRDNNDIKLKQVKKFNIGCCRNEILKMIKFINENIGKTDIVIVSSHGFPFKIFSNINDVIGQQGKKALNKLGSQRSVFRQDDNYILLTSMIGDIYYEFLSPEPIYFPYIDIIEKKCKENPGNIKYPLNYIIFNDKSYGQDKILKCAIESHIRDHSKFGIYKDYCIPMTDKEYNDQYSQMPNKTNCLDYMGNKDSVAGYVVNKIYNYNQLLNNKKDGVIFYDDYYLKGKNIVLNEGEYQSLVFNRQKIKSIYVPYGYFVFLIFDHNIVPFYGPLKVNLTGFYNKFFGNIEEIIIQKYYEGNTVLCGIYNDKKICTTYGKGKHILHPKLFLKYLSVNMGNAQQVSVHGNITHTDLIQTFYQNRDAQRVQIEFPRIARGIVID